MWEAPPGNYTFDLGTESAELCLAIVTSLTSVVGQRPLGLVWDMVHSIRILCHRGWCGICMAYGPIHWTVIHGSGVDSALTSMAAGPFVHGGWALPPG